MELRNGVITVLSIFGFEHCPEKYATNPGLATLLSLWNFIHMVFPELVMFSGRELPQNLPKRGDDELSPSRI